MKCMIQLILFALMVMGAATPVLAVNDVYDRQLAMDLAWELARPDLEIQQQGSGNQHYRNLLTVLLTGVELEEEFLTDLVREWRSRNAADLYDAVLWCQTMSAAAPDMQLKGYWLEQEVMLRRGMIAYQQKLKGVPPYLIRTWAYFRRFYGEARNVPDRWAGGPMARHPGNRR